MKLSQIPIKKPFITQLKCDKDTLITCPNKKSFPLSTKPRQVFDAHFSHVLPKKTKSKLLSLNKAFLKELNLEVDDDEILSGNRVLEESFPWASNYGGHQFGSWAGQLGDGRAISLFQAEFEGKLLEFQLKGAGMTPYSRFADGFAVLRSSIREYLCAEAMHALGVPSSRSISLHQTGNQKTYFKINKSNEKL
jgi:serine/tyrosine/threonine adenylyltransferase